MATTYRMDGDREYTRDELREKILDEVAGLDPQQWQDGVFDFDDWLANSVITGHVVKVGNDL